MKIHTGERGEGRAGVVPLGSKNITFSGFLFLPFFIFLLGRLPHVRYPPAPFDFPSLGVNVESTSGRK